MVAPSASRPPTKPPNSSSPRSRTSEKSRPSARCSKTCKAFAPTRPPTRPPTALRRRGVEEARASKAHGRRLPTGRRALTGVPTPGAIAGSQTSRSNETCTPAGVLPGNASACSTTDAMPARSISFIVNTCTRDARTISFSRSSRFLIPMRTVCSGSTFGEKPPMRDSSAGSGPSSAASGMPCTLPLATSPACSCRRARRPRSARSGGASRAAPSRLPPRPTRRRCCDRRRARAACPLVERRERRLVELLADARDLADVYSCCSDRRRP